MSKTQLVCAFLVSVSVAIAGCTTTAGPFVTNISSDGQGNLVIEKAMVEYSQWSDGITTKNHTTTTIHIGAPSPAMIPEPAVPKGAPAFFENVFQGIVVRLASTSEGRKPFLRVDVHCFFDKAIAADKVLAARLAGFESADAIIRCLGNLPTVEDIEVDQNSAQDAAEEAIKQGFANSGLPVPHRVRFQTFDLQG